MGGRNGTWVDVRLRCVVDERVPRLHPERTSVNASEWRVQPSGCPYRKVGLVSM